MEFQQALPDQIKDLSTDELKQRIIAAKEKLGKKLVILGHHYQRDEVIAFADITGDSLKLAQAAAEQRDADFVVFAGVHFMAESADILTSDSQTVCLPSLRAGCAMAEMADDQDVQAALDELAGLTDETIIPVTYVNSTAAIKAITARAGGACCTSSNAKNVFSWAFAPAKSGGAGAGKVFAVPDQHLARNTAIAMGYTEEDCVIYDPALPSGGLDAETVKRARFLLWKGHCYVHQLFTVQDVQQARVKDPEATIIVHPECPREIVKLADAAGSTGQIINAISQAEAGTSWFVGTEGNLVNRLNQTHPDKTVRLLADRPARCSHMAQVDLPHLAWVLQSIVDGEPENVIRVDASIADDARLAVQRMIDIPGTSSLTQVD